MQESILQLVKYRLGLTSTVRDEYLKKRIISTLEQLTAEKDIKIDEQNINLMVFIADLTVWQYQSIGKDGAMPRDLRLRLNNILMTHTKKDGSV